MKLSTTTIISILLLLGTHGIGQQTTPIGLKIDQGQKVVFGDNEPLEDNGSGNIKEDESKRGIEHTFFAYDPVKGYLLTGTINSQHYSSESYGFGSTSLGSDSKAIGPYSFAGGHAAIAYWNKSFAFGHGAFANAESAQSFGRNTSNNTPHSMVIGQYNHPVYINRHTDALEEKSALFLVGNGSSTSNRSNALELYFDGSLNLSKPNVVGSNILGLTLQADDIYMDAAGPQKFGDDLAGNDGGKGDPFLLSTGEGSSESAGIYGDGDALVLFSEGESPGASGLNGYVFILDASHFGGDTNPYDLGAIKAYIDDDGMWQTSDKRKKENIKRVTTANETINKLNGYSYSFRSIDNKKSDASPSIGFLAQELQEVIPEAVQQSAHGDYFVNYTMVVPVLTEAIKEQNEKIELLIKANEKMAQQIINIQSLQSK